MESERVAEAKTMDEKSRALFLVLSELLNEDRISGLLNKCLDLDLEYAVMYLLSMGGAFSLLSQRVLSLTNLILKDLPDEGLELICPNGQDKALRQVALRIPEILKRLEAINNEVISTFELFHPDPTDPTRVPSSEWEIATVGNFLVAGTKRRKESDKNETEEN